MNASAICTFGRFIHHDAERLPFDDASFDVVYSNGVLHYTPDTARLAEIHLRQSSLEEALSRTAEVSDNDASLLVKVYSRARLDRLLGAFAERVITQHQLTAGELPLPLRPFRSMLEPHAGWNLVVKAVRA